MEDFEKKNENLNELFDKYASLVSEMHRLSSELERSKFMAELMSIEEKGENSDEKKESAEMAAKIMSVLPKIIDDLDSAKSNFRVVQAKINLIQGNISG